MKKSISKKKYLIFLILFIIFVFLTLYFIKDIYIIDNFKENTIEVHSSFEELNKKINIKAKYCSLLFKLNCIDISDKLNQETNIDLDTLGNYNINYKIEYKGKNKQLKKTIIVRDTTPPVITLKDTGLSCPNKFVEPGYTVTDNYSENLEKKVSIKRVDTTIYYTVSDESGNETTVQRELKFGDTIPPVITLKGYETEYVLINNKYKEPGYTVTDNCDSSVVDKITVTGYVNTNAVGTYKLEYRVEDSSNNVSTATRTVKVYKSQDYATIIPTNKVIYLTFDDGPGPYTEQLLQILKKYNVKATFFVTNQFPGYNYLIKKEYNEGHAIGIHSYSHVYKNIYSSVDNYFNDVNKMDNIIYSQTGIHSYLLRFPGGSSNTISKFNKGIMTTLSKETQIRGYKYFDWNVASNDTGTSNKTTIYNNIINGVKSHNYSIVLQHDIKKYSVETVEDVIRYGLENGYTFLPLDLTSPTAHHGINN